ncbi:MAG: TetR/AcrR family transcriptional regulator [Sphingomonadaceae bacterium]|nr:TetR/AcrR family transcriptional regulator [Sphingomonadaceae bacterium]
MTVVDESGEPATVDKAPRTDRGRRTLRAMLDAAAGEFGERGFHDASIARITARAGVALGSFYTYFESKEAVFRALVNDMSAQVRTTVGPHILAAPDRLTGERQGLRAFLDFVREHKELYRILDEAEFVDPASWRTHYENTVAGYVVSLTAAAGRGEVRADVSEIHAWAIVGMNVFLGLRYGVWEQDEAAEQVASIASALLKDGLKP